MKIITSDTNRLLIDKVTQEISDLAGKNLEENYCLIVPEKFSVTMEKLLLQKSKSHTFLNVQVVTLSRLLYKLLPSTNNYLSKNMGIMTTKKVIIENYDRLVCYKKTAKTMGFAENIYDTISELKNSKVTPEDYYAKNKTGTSLDIKLHDIFLLYNEYENFLKKEGLVDASDRFDLLATEISKSEYIKNSNVYIMGYDSTTRSGMGVFSAIASRAKSITCACLDNSGKWNSYVCPPEMLNNYLELAKQLGQSPLVVKAMESKMTVAHHIANNLYAYPYSKMKVNGEVAIYEAQTVIEELRVVAQDIRRQIMENALRYRDFAIVCQDIENIKDLISMVFGEYKLPYFLDSAEKLTDHPLARFVESALNVIRKNYSVEEVLGLCANIFSGVDAERYSGFENYVVKYAINYDDFKKPFKIIKKDLDEPAKSEQSRAEEVRLEVVSKLMQVEKIIKSASVASEYAQGISLLFELFNVDEKLETFGGMLTEYGKVAIKDASKQVKQKIEELLVGADKIFADTKIGFDEYFAVVQSGLASETISLIPVSVDNIFIGNISTSKFFGVKNLYVVGAVDGAIPFVKDDCGIIVDKELQLISSTLGKKIEPTIKTINSREKFKLINILQEFSEKLTISYSLSGKTGEEQRPSSLVREISKIFYRVEDSKPLEPITKERMVRFRGIMSEQDKASSYAYEFSTIPVAVRGLLNYINKVRNDEPVIDPKIYSSLYRVLTLGYRDQAGIIVDTLFAPPKEGLKNAGRLYFKDNKTSVTQLECYFSCPFKFFANYGLRLRPREEAYLKSVDYGNVLHEIAERYIKNIKKYEIDSGKPLSEKQEELEKLINKVFSEEKLQLATNKYMLLQLKKEAFRLIDALTYQYRESNFKPIGEEVRFGNEGDMLPGVDVGRRIRVAGKIDRLDMFKDYYRVVDYKTGHIDLSPKATYYGQKVQLFLYLKAMRKLRKKPAGAFYLPIRNVFVDENDGDNYSTYKMQGYFNQDPEVVKNMDRRISPENNKSDIVNISVSGSKENKETNQIVASGQNALTERDIRELEDYVCAMCADAVGEILSGYTETSPIESDGRTPCEYCEYRSACGRDFNSNLAVRKQKANIKFESFIQRETK